MAAAQEPQRVSAADFIRGFANWRMQTAREPVFVTHHGKDAHVLISLADYRRLDGEEPIMGAAARCAMTESRSALIESMRDGVILIDRQRRIVAVNPAACDRTEMPAARLVGADLIAGLPGLKDSLLLHHITRLIDHRERFSGDLPGFVDPRRWLHIDLVPVAIGGAIILRDISAAMEGFAADGSRLAMAAALEAHGAIGHAQLSVREMVEDANAPLMALVGTDAAAIRRVRFSALLTIGQRQAFVEALETLFRTGAPARLDSELVTRDGAALGVTLAMAERRGPYASEGAVVLVTRR